ncbi:hypothetical protein E2I00_001101 [Balaenoptera physalus]|uniref:Uncharacterized protein n=1 Tax=Balaenoptera physalus TaxID=9770 RepID=A0A643BSH7_BALPH|nr:hypothetical protein E2I00_001101 [Balaenoptera physalus]
MRSVQNGQPPASTPASSGSKALHRLSRRRSKDVEFQDGWPRSPGRAFLPLRHRSSSEITLSECDLEDVVEPRGARHTGALPLFREYGSTSSIDVQGVPEQSFFDILNELRSEQPEARGAPSLTELLRADPGPHVAGGGGGAKGDARNGQPAKDGLLPLQPMKEKEKAAATRWTQHANYFGVDEKLGPVAVSIKREKLEDHKDHGPQYQYRIIFRTHELTTLRGSILEDATPTAMKHGTGRGLPLKDALEYVIPELNIHCLRLALNTPKVTEQLLKLDEQGLCRKHKVGILYCKAGQSSEEEMYNNEEAGPAFEEFLSLIGEKVCLKGFTKYAAQLDVKTDSTGTHSLYTTYQDYEIMFHVSTLLPYTPNNRQQLLRKRHIGNDIVTIIFQEPGALPFTPKNIRSHFQHVFIIVRVHKPCTDSVCYSMAVTRSKDAPPFGPPIPSGTTFRKSDVFRDFLLAKVMTNGWETVDMTLRRNGLGQLGFHVKYDGTVAEVEDYGFAWQAGLRQGSRLVEICKVAVVTLTHDQMIDLLRTSVTVKVVIIPPFDDGTPRRPVSFPETPYTASPAGVDKVPPYRQPSGSFSTPGSATYARYKPSPERYTAAPHPLLSFDPHFSHDGLSSGESSSGGLTSQESTMERQKPATISASELSLADGRDRPLRRLDPGMMPLPDTAAGLEWSSLVNAAKAYEDHLNHFGDLIMYIDKCKL